MKFAKSMAFNFYGCSYGAKLKLLYSEKIVLYSEKNFHIQRKCYYIQRNISIFTLIFLCLKKFSIFGEIEYLKKLFYIQRIFISIEIVFIQRNVFYSKKMLILKEIGIFKGNLKFKFQIINHSRVSSCIFDVHKEN